MSLEMQPMHQKDNKAEVVVEQHRPFGNNLDRYPFNPLNLRDDVPISDLQRACLVKKKNILSLYTNGNILSLYSNENDRKKLEKDITLLRRALEKPEGKSISDIKYEFTMRLMDPVRVRKLAREIGVDDNTAFTVIMEEVRLIQEMPIIYSDDGTYADFANVVIHLSLVPDENGYYNIPDILEHEMRHMSHWQGQTHIFSKWVGDSLGYDYFKTEEFKTLDRKFPQIFLNSYGEKSYPDLKKESEEKYYSLPTEILARKPFFESFLEKITSGTGLDFHYGQQVTEEQYEFVKDYIENCSKEEGKTINKDAVEFFFLFNKKDIIHILNNVALQTTQENADGEQFVYIKSRDGETARILGVTNKENS